MGQRIEVQATQLGHVALFELDRSLTGQDAATFTGPPGLDDEPSRALAGRLFSAIPGLTSVNILSNTVTLGRDSDWDENTVETAIDTIATLFIHYEPISAEAHADQLREANYNSTITWIRAHNPELWVIRITPDEPIEPFQAGQYTTLGLGYWEPRADDALEDFDGHPEQSGKMARRSYSVSSSIVDADGELVEAHPPDVEFYIVQVRPGEEEIPALTPRIFLKGVGDRMYMSHKFTGRYTLDGVQPTDTVVFLSTGTGEAPQNKMTAELLRGDHQGKIISVVCVRYRDDLAYIEQQAAVVARHPNYQYVTLTTREPENEGNKVYIQDMIASGRLEEELGAPLDPATTHVFLCGNPSMIGLPKWAQDGSLTFPEPIGVCELLHERGFTIDHLKERGNVHYEEYWKDR